MARVVTLLHNASDLRRRLAVVSENATALVAWLRAAPRRAPTWSCWPTVSRMQRVLVSISCVARPRITWIALWFPALPPAPSRLLRAAASRSDEPYAADAPEHPEAEHDHPARRRMQEIVVDDAWAERTQGALAGNVF